MLAPITEVKYALERLMLQEQIGTPESEKLVSLYADLLKIEMDTPRDKWSETFVALIDAARESVGA